MHKAEHSRGYGAPQAAAWGGRGVWQVRVGTLLPPRATPLHADGLQIHPVAVPACNPTSQLIELRGLRHPGIDRTY